MKPRSGLLKNFSWRQAWRKNPINRRDQARGPNLAKVEARSHQEGQAGRASPWPAVEAQRKEQARSSNLGVREARPL